MVSKPSLSPLGYPPYFTRTKPYSVECEVVIGKNSHPILTRDKFSKECTMKRHPSHLTSQFCWVELGPKSNRYYYLKCSLTLFSCSCCSYIAQPVPPLCCLLLVLSVLLAELLLPVYFCYL